MKKTAEIIILDTEADYLVEFTETYVKGSFVLNAIPVNFIEADFSHIFFEPGKGNIKDASFSKRRAKKMHFIKAILSGEFAIEIMFEDDTGNIAVFCVDLDCVIYLRIRKGSGKLQLATFFDFGKEHTKMYEKQKKKCVPITDTQLQEKLET